MGAQDGVHAALIQGVVEIYSWVAVGWLAGEGVGQVTKQLQNVHNTLGGSSLLHAVCEGRDRHQAYTLPGSGAALQIQVQ